MKHNDPTRREALALGLSSVALAALSGRGRAADKATLTMVVMDPLALPLSCPCVKGYAQRQYERLGEYLEKQLERPVHVAFDESLTKAMHTKTEGKADIVIGKESVVKADAKKASLPLTHVAALTDKDGKTTQTGLVVVPARDPAKKVSDLKGYRIIFGPEECDEKHAAALDLLLLNGVAAPTKLETCSACSDGATTILELDSEVRAAAVISSYAAPLLEGCGTIKKGDLRVVGTTEPVPFVAAFVADSLAAEDREAIVKALLKVGERAELLAALETKSGFVAPKTLAAKKSSNGNRGPAGRLDRLCGIHRDAIVPWLPDKLPEKLTQIWRTPVGGRCLAGLAATRSQVIVAGRDLADTMDVFRCLDANTGTERWAIRQPTKGNLDYGNSPRATPLILDGLVFLYGAFGHMHCVELESGKVRWRKELPAEFDAHEKLPWGFCSAPLAVDNKLIVNPGGASASLVALAPQTGEVLWKTPGGPPCYGSLIAGTFGGRMQVVGHDATSLDGWDVASGKGLWRVIPARKGDFNVPTPIAYDGQVIVSTENNGTRMFRFGQDGQIDPKPVAVNAELSPDTQSPVVVGTRLFGVKGGLHCLDLKNGLKQIWLNEEDVFDDHVSLIGSERQVLASGMKGELRLIDAQCPTCKLLGKLTVLEDETGIYAHPAVVGDRLYLRGNDAVYCFSLAS